MIVKGKIPRYYSIIFDDDVQGEKTVYYYAACDNQMVITINFENQRRDFVQPHLFKSGICGGIGIDVFQCYS
jgi:hypothetical protein